MFRKSQDINNICQEREQLLSQLRRSKRIKMIDEKRNNIILYNSLNELLNAHPELENSDWNSYDYIDFIKGYWEISIACILTLKSNHFLMAKVDKFEEITDIISNFDNFKYVIIIVRHKYIYIDNQFDLRNLIENSSNIFKWWDDRRKLLCWTYNTRLYYPRVIENDYKFTSFDTNILEEVYNYIVQNHNDVHNPILLELDITDKCYKYHSFEDDNKKYEVINEIDLLNQNIITLKNGVDLKQRKYVVAFIEIDPDEISDSEDYDYHYLQLIQIDKLDQLELLKRWIDCEPYVYKTI